MWWGEFQAAQRAWVVEDDPDKARQILLRLIANGQDGPNTPFDQSLFLEELAKVEARQKNRADFEAAYQRVFALHPTAPMPRLNYARVLRAELNDAEGTRRAIEAIRQLLGSGMWKECDTDLSRRAYEKKIDTLEAWTRGEKGGELWP